MATSDPSSNESAVAMISNSTTGILSDPVRLIAYVRAYLRDYPELNRLIDGKETSDRQIANALIDAVGDWNTTPPLLTSVTVQSFPSLNLLLRGATVYILQSVAFLQLRNQLTYSDGQGIQSSVSNKSPQLMSWANLFNSQYEQKKRSFKIAQNVHESMGGTSFGSEYEAVNGFFSEIY